MPSINMIAARRSDKKRLENNMRRLLAVILAEVVLGVVLGLVFTLNVWTINSRIADLGVDLAKLQPAVKKIESFEKATARLTPKLELLDDAKKQTSRWYGLMAKLSEVLPGGTWLTKISTDTAVVPAGAPEPSGINVSLNGYATNQNRVGDAMLNLNSYRDFDRVELNFTQKGAIGTLEAVEFQIQTVLKNNETKKEDKSSGDAKS